MLISTKSRFRLSLNKLEVPFEFQYTDRMKNKEPLQESIQKQITYIPIPKGVDIDVVAEIIADDQYDIIFLKNGILCKNDRVKDVKAAIKAEKEGYILIV